MGIDLVGHGELHLRLAWWVGCCALAQSFGWEPAGTIPAHDHPNPDHWDGQNYFTNDYQEVTADDARAMGAALARALDALKNLQEPTDEQAEAWAGVGMSFRLVRQVADFAQAGGFSIY